jgi:hypothetical protein
MALLVWLATLYKTALGVNALQGSPQNLYKIYNLIRKCPAKAPW